MLKEKILLSIAAGMLTTTCALAPTLANCTSVTQADVDKMNGIEKSITKTAREYLFGLKGSDEQLVFEDEDARVYLLDDSTVKQFADETGEDEEDVKLSFTAIADINDTLIEGCKRIGEGLREGQSFGEILGSIDNLGVEIASSMNPVWAKMGYSSDKLEQDIYKLKYGNCSRNPDRVYTNEELEMMQPLVAFGNALGIEGFGY